ncbi:MAG TPA: SEC-C metal-binding domain-containing protein [Gemmataceae bacterium]|nr:SEC-C metal-binding domain-containing protein [Gemmataceae bacterium]
MGRKRISRNAPCPCGSGKKYKVCCYGKGFEWQQDEQGHVSRSLPLSDEMKTVLEQQKQKFIEKFGREPGPNDPIFFDAPPVEQVEFQMVQAMKKAGLNPAFIYAFEKTGGLLVTEANQHLIPEKDLAAWDAAIREYEAKHGGSRPGKKAKRH